jgi:hypothetical protein
MPSIYCPERFARTHNKLQSSTALTGLDASFYFMGDMYTFIASSSGNGTDADSCSTVPLTPEDLDGENGDTCGSSRTDRPGRRVACDSCRRRKVRCDGNQTTCGRCSKLNQSCVYTVPKNRHDSEMMAQALIMLQSRLGKWNSVSNFCIRPYFECSFDSFSCHLQSKRRHV